MCVLSVCVCVCVCGVVVLWCCGIPTKSMGAPWEELLLDGALHMVLAMVCLVCITVSVIGRAAAVAAAEDVDDDNDVDDDVSIGD